MGLTVYYDWKTKTDLPSARRLIAKFRAIALKLPFDEVSEIYEQDPPDGKSAFRPCDHSFRQGGLPHQLLVLADLSQALREEERQAWQRLLRVLGHELNNSLAPIKSISGSLASLLGKEPQPVDWKDDMQRGLGVITARADAKIGRAHV